MSEKADAPKKTERTRRRKVDTRKQSYSSKSEQKSHITAPCGTYPKRNLPRKHMSAKAHSVALNEGNTMTMYL